MAWRRLPTTSLWRRADFVKLFGGEMVSNLGGQVTNFALPLVAVVTLEATPGQMGLFFAAFSLSGSATELLSGAWVDRLRPWAACWAPPSASAPPSWSAPPATC